MLQYREENERKYIQSMLLYREEKKDIQSMLLYREVKEIHTEHVTV